MQPAKTETIDPRALGLQAAPAAAALGHLLDSQLAAAAALRPALAALERAADAAARALQAGHRLAYAGAGSSGLMALADALELPGTFGIPAASAPVLFAGGAAALLNMTGAVEDDPALAAADLARVAFRPGDAVICVSASGTTPYTLAVAEGARQAGATVIGLANVPGSPLLAAADIPVLLDTGAELVAGSTRMGAGTAQKIALNMISTLTGLKLGHVHDGQMVNLTADNAKLAARAARMVEAIAETAPDTAAAALAAAGGRVKPAILIAAGASAHEAGRLIDAHRGHLGPALAALGRETTPKTGSATE